MEIRRIIEKLCISRPIFHSEADFQFALAWMLQSEYPDANIRLEYLISNGSNKKEYVDILVTYREKVFPIELKYKTRKLQINFNGESYDLANQGAQDEGCYGFVKDISRIELFSKTIPNFAKGFAIWLTNDPWYWKNPKSWNSNTMDAEFRVYENFIKAGTMGWIGDKKEKEFQNPIILEGEYHINWFNYSNFNQIYGEFMYSLNTVG